MKGQRPARGQLFRDMDVYTLLISASERFISNDHEGGVGDALAALSLARKLGKEEDIAICCVVLADHYQNEGMDPRRALEYLKSCLELRPDEVEVHASMAKCYEALNQSAKASEHVEIAKRLERLNVQPDITLADWMKVSRRDR